MFDVGAVLAATGANLGSPMVLFFVLGAAAALARSDLTVPEAVAKAIALYLMLSIGFKGGAGVAAHGVDLRLALTLIAAALLSFALPFLSYALLRLGTALNRIEAAAVAGHYGSISIVTFVAATEYVKSAGLEAEGYMVAAAAVMEAPAILAAIWLASRKSDLVKPGATLWREVALNGAVVLLVGSFLIGWATGEAGLERISPFIVAPFLGVLCLFLLDMGLVAGRGLKQGLASRAIDLRTILFALYMPLISASLAFPIALVLGLSQGGAALFMTLAASASYIAAPAAMRLALPEARPAVYLTLSLAITFPFNLVVGVPLYAAAAKVFAAG